jgi:DNA-binding SARP family transcriptional activator
VTVRTAGAADPGLGGALLECRVLGPVEVCRDGRGVPLDGAKQRTVLAALLLAGKCLVADTRLSDLLWGRYPPTTSSAQIYTYISRLRRALGPDAAILRRPPGYLLYVEAVRFDLAEFETCASAGHAGLVAGRYEEAAAMLRAALSCWRGPALADTSVHLAEAEGPRLEEARLAVVESRLEADLAMGHQRQVLVELIQLVRLYPLRERFRAQLMTALYRCDRQAEALARYDEGRRLLADELGVDPGMLLREVYHAILTADPRLSVLGLVVPT